MTQSDPVIKLLLVEDSANATEQLVSELRNGGIPVSPVQVTNEAELIEQLRARTPDLILANFDATQLPLAKVGEILKRSGKDSSLIAMSKTVDSQRLLDVLRAGAEAHVLLGNAEVLQHVVRRESTGLATRRAVNELQSALHESERRCDALLDSSRDPIAYVHEGMHVRANQAYLEMFGFAGTTEIEGMSILDLIAPVDAENFKSTLKRMAKSVKPTQTLGLKAKRADGATFDAQIELSSATYEGEPCLQIVFRRQAASEEMAKQLEALRSRDMVTGLYNRQHCVTALESICSDSTPARRDHALLLLEPDNFRQLTETLGLDAIDLLLSELAQLLQRHLGANNIAGRFDRQTLGLITVLNSIESVNELGEALRRGCEERIFELGEKSVSLTISVGISLIGAKVNSASAVLTRATEALRSAQSEGGNRVQTIDPAAQEKAEEAEALEQRERIRHALANNGFQLHYQGVVSLQGAEGEYREILLRMRSKDGDLRPSEFLPAAQRYGLLPAIDRWVIARVLQLLSGRDAAHQSDKFFIKISLPTLEDDTLVPWLTTQLQEKKIRCDALIFELPENGAATVLKHVLGFVRAIKKLGCGFALEGFSGSPTGLQLLKHTDADYLKIDRSFMANLAQSKESIEKIRQICAQIRSTGKLSIAEFVEDAASMSILFSCGVDFVQGNFLQEPELVMAESNAA